MRNVGLSHRGRRAIGTLIGFVALAALVTPAAQAETQLKPAILNVTGWRIAGPTVGGVRLAGVPLPNSGDKIGPGSYLLIKQTDNQSYICTANFVWSGSGGPYLGAAGHCFLPPNVAAQSAPNQYVSRVQVCVASCAFGGQLGAVIQGTLQDLGDVVFARQSQNGVDVGNDFGLVQIPTSLLGSVRQSVPVWGGPNSSTAVAPTLGSRVCLYGNAAGLGEVFATKARFGIGGFRGATDPSWYATIPSAPGDSGAAVVNCALLSGTTAAGILTHLATNGTGVIAGTTVARAQQMVASEAGLNISIVPAP